MALLIEVPGIVSLVGLEPVHDSRGHYTAQHQDDQEQDQKRIQLPAKSTKSRIEFVI